MKYAVKEELTKPHSKFEGSETWSLTEEGIKVKDAAPERTEGRPITVESIWSAFHQPINKYSREYGVPVELIVATIATESRGGETLVIEAPGFQSDTVTPHLVRAGLMQNVPHLTAGMHSVGLERVRQWLLTGENAVKAGTSLIARHKRETGYDPILVAAAYRADGIRQDDGEGNRFKLAQWPLGSSGNPDYCDNFIKWFNDFWAVLGVSHIRPALSLREHFHGRPGDRFSLPLDLETQLDPTLDTLGKYFKHTEQDFVGGYFPVGANTTWHGGVHLLGKEGDTVHAIAKGVVVRARMPSKDSGQDDLKYGSRNFVLIRHGEGENVWYSLYYHLKSVDNGSDGANRITWLQARELEFKRTVPLWKTAASIGANAIHYFENKDFATILHEDKDDTYYVLRPEADGIRTRGYVKFFDQYMEIGRRSDKVLGSDEVVELNIPVEAGDVVGILGKGITKGDNGIEEKDILHWAVISPELMPGFLNSVNDEDEDFICDSGEIFKFIDSGLDENDKTELVASEIEDFFKDEARARKLRPIACKFKSEWAVDWNSQKKAMSKASLSANVERLKLYNFWDNANGIDGKLPASGHVWHYNPITYLHRQLFRSARANFSREMFEKNSTFLLPEKAISLLCGIGNHGGDDIKTAFLIGHKGVNGDSGDAIELSKARAEALGAILTLDEAGIGAQIDNGHWGDRERRIMLRWLKTDDGAPYYQGSITKDDPAALEAAVKAFQRAGGLNDDGAAGKSTFAKMFERMLQIAGIEPFQSVETIGAGEAYAKARGKPEDCVVEGLFWTTDVEPALEQHEQEPEATYKEWQAFIRKEIGPGVPKSNTAEILLRRHGLSERWLKDGTLRDMADGQHLEPGSYVYLFKNGHLWREFKVSEGSKLQEVDLGKCYGKDVRTADGDPDIHLEIPVPTAGNSPTVEIALASVQWSWSRVLAFGGLNPSDPRRGEDVLDVQAFNDEKRAERLTIIDLSQQDSKVWCKPEQFPEREDLRPYVESKLLVCHVDDPLGLALESSARMHEARLDLEECLEEVEKQEHYKSATLSYQLFFNEALHAKKQIRYYDGVIYEYEATDDQSELLRECSEVMSEDVIEGILKVNRRKDLRLKVRTCLAAHAALLAGCLPPKSLGEKRGAAIKDSHPAFISFEAAFEDYAYLTGADYFSVWSAFTEHAGNLNYDPSYIDRGNDLAGILEEEKDAICPGSWFLEEVLRGNGRLNRILFPKEEDVDPYSANGPQPQQIDGQESIVSADFRPDAFAAALAELSFGRGVAGSSTGYKSNEGAVKFVDKVASEFLSNFSRQWADQVNAVTPKAPERLIRWAQSMNIDMLAGIHMVKPGDSVANLNIITKSGGGTAFDKGLVDKNGLAIATFAVVPKDSLLADTLRGAGKTLPPTIAVFELFNLVGATQTLIHSKTGENVAKTMHSLISLGVAVTEAATALKGETYMTNLATKGNNSLVRGIGKFATGKSYSPIAMALSGGKGLSYVKGTNGVLAIFGAWFAYQDAVGLSKSHDFDASVAGFANSAAQLWLGLATLGLIPGGTIALAVVLLTVVLVAWLSESELKRWAESGPFAKSPADRMGDHYHGLTGKDVYAALLTQLRAPKVELKKVEMDEMVYWNRYRESTSGTFGEMLTSLARGESLYDDNDKENLASLLEFMQEKPQNNVTAQEDENTPSREIIAVDVYAPGWGPQSRLEVALMVAPKPEDTVFLPEPKYLQTLEKPHFHLPLREGKSRHGPIIGWRYFYRVKPLSKFPRRYYARARHIVEDGVKLPFLWPDWQDEVVGGTQIDVKYKEPGWAYPENVLDI